MVDTDAQTQTTEPQGLLVAATEARLIEAIKQKDPDFGTLVDYHVVMIRLGHSERIFSVTWEDKWGNCFTTGIAIQ